MTSWIHAQFDELKFKHRMAKALRKSTPQDPATPEELDRLVDEQLASWRHAPPPGSVEAAHELTRFNAHVSGFVLSIRGTSVRLWPKAKPPAKEPEDEAARHERQAFLRRARFYRAFIEKVLRRNRLRLDLEIGIDVNDLSEDRQAIPIFCFQKPAGSRRILLPDVDFFHCKWYLEPADALSYAEKKVSAVFVGSSTGAQMTFDMVRSAATPRLRAATYFIHHPNVDFKIANAVQCQSKDAKEWMERQPYFSAPATWSEQLRHRFIISIDGNGAACSRLVRGLRSNSVVIKYESPHALYWFPALQAGRDFLAVTEESDIERIVAAEQSNDGVHQRVSDAGQRFADKYLTIGSVMDYTARLLNAYSALRRGHTQPQGAPRPAH